VAGATGAIGRQLVPRLAAAGHEVHAMTHSEAKQAMLGELGAVAVVADALDPEQVVVAVARAKPEVIVHQLTAIGSVDLRPMDRDFALVGDGGTEQPTRAPWLAAGEAGAVLVTQLGGAANAKATRALGWQPRHPSWRQGLAT
jgi:NAD(P)-dependent dehydrogenase (short-subunit alcohol dehydrogenase family)